jgi:hypothetical protein
MPPSMDASPNSFPTPRTLPAAEKIGGAAAGQ